MRITKVVALPLRSKSVFVQVFCENGMYGIGECYPIFTEWGAKWLAYFIENCLAPKILGEDATRIEHLWHRLYSLSTARQGDKSVMMSAISGVDIALWDLLGKLTERPVYDLIGGAVSSEIPLYASIGGGDVMSPEQMLAAVEVYRELGFQAFKIRMHWGSHRVDQDPQKDLAQFKKVRESLPIGIPLAFDANNGYSVKMAIQQGRRLEESGVSHYEEPIAHYDYSGLKQVVEALNVPVAAGEQEYTRWQFKDLIERSNVDILQPDVVKCGGISEFKKILTYASICNKVFLPHQNQATIGLLASLHVVATQPGTPRPQEFLGNCPEVASLFKENPKIENGTIKLPDAPGLGLSIDEERLRDAVLP